MSINLNKDIKRRRSLLPWWIKSFIWLFLIIGLLALISLVFGFYGLEFQLSFFGLATNNPLSIMGLCIIVLLLLKFVTAFALWTEKDWAITLARIEGSFGIAFCFFMMILFPFINIKSGFNLNFRLEIILLIPYLIKLDKVKDDWKKFTIATI